MELVTTEKMLLDAKRNKYSVCAFNVENMEMVIAVIEAANELNSPVIIQTTPSTVKYAGLDYYIENVRVAAKRSNIPIAMHLDHGTSYNLTIQAVRQGYTSIMIDGSHNSFDENIAITKSVVDFCNACKISVEAELGKVGGKEDDMDNGDSNIYTDPYEAEEFIKRTGVGSLAIAIGTAHGIYKGEPKLDLDRLSKINDIVDIPLVLHGASGVPDTIVKEAIKRGICKVNYATELRIAYSNAVKYILKENPNIIDPKKYGNLAIEYVKKFAMEKMNVCGCVNKA